MVKDRLFRGDDFEYERSRREDFDPIAEGKRNGLGAELSRTIWDHARREATSHHGLCDESLAREIFAQITKRIAEHDGQPGAAPGKTTQVDVVSGSVPAGNVLAERVPGKTTRVLATPSTHARVGLSQIPGRTTLMAGAAEANVLTPEDSRGFFRRYIGGSHAARSKLDSAIRSRNHHAAVAAMRQLQHDLKSARHHLANGLAHNENLRAELDAVEGLAEQQLAKLPNMSVGGLPWELWGPESAEWRAAVGAAVEPAASEPAPRMVPGAEHESRRLVEAADRDELPGPSVRLPASIQSRMERAYDRRFDDVEIHPESADVPRGQLAFTRGRHIYLEPGAVNLASARGEYIIAHELVHVAQQDGASNRAGSLKEVEQEATRAADLAMHGQMARIALSAQPATAYGFSEEHEPDESKEVGHAPESAEIDPSVAELVARARRASVPLDSALRSELEGALDVHLDAVRVHVGADADAAAQALGAVAFAIDDDVFFRNGVYNPQQPDGQRLIAHEVAHTVQSRGTRTALDSGATVNPPDSAPEREAEAFADEFVSRINASGSHGTDPPATMSVDRRQSVERRHDENATERVTRMAVLERTGPGISLHPAEKILRYSIKWLTKRGTRTVSKHIARHARRIAGRAIHSVFKHPRHIKSMIESTVKEAVELAAKHAKKPVQEAIEDGAIKITQQATGTPGKVRWIVEKTFRQAIGTQGERILRIVVDQSGRIVSAFPTDRLIAIGLGVGAVGILGERSAEAAERARGHAERDANKENDSSWLDFVPFIGDIWSGNLNSGEAEDLRLRDELERDIREVIAAIEAEEKRKLTADERRLVEETFRAAVAAPLLHESDDEESL